METNPMITRFISTCKKVTANILILGLTISFFACNSASPVGKKNAKNSVIAVHDSLKENKSDKTKVHDPKNDCTRGQAEPILKKAVFPRSTFVLQPDSISAIETLSYNNGDKLIIRNWGCEYYALTFRFETSRFRKDTTNLEYWYRSADLLMREIIHGIDSPIDVKKGLSKLIDYVNNDQPNNYRNLKLEEEITIDGEEGLPSTVSVDRIEKLSDKKYAVEITFGIGPL